MAHLVNLRRDELKLTLTRNTQVQNIEFSQIQASVVHGLKQGNAVLKEIHRELNPESVERLMEETADAVAYQREVDEMLASRMTREEEDEVQDELEALEREARREAGEVVDEPVKQPVKEVSVCAVCARGAVVLTTIGAHTQVQLPTAPTEEPLAQVPATRIPEQSQEQVSEELREAILA